MAAELLNPDDFIISKKRKKYKFAMFANANNCFELEEWTKQPADIIEIGAGTGLFGVELAKRHPERQVVCIDVKADRLQKGAYEALAAGIANIRFLRARADQIDELFVASSVSSIWVTFADPFMRPRSARRRMTHALYLEKYKQLLGVHGSLYVKHDNETFFCWSLEQLVSMHWHINELSFDLHDSELTDDYKILTTYEQRWLGQGLRTNFVSASPGANNTK